MKRPPALSTICTSLAIGLGGTAGAGAQDGCFARDFGAAHLAANPDQVVAELSLYFTADAVRPGMRYAEIAARMAPQGHALRRGVGGMRLEEFALCSAAGVCAIACDGGSFTISAFDGDSIEIQTADARVSAQPCTPDTVVSTLASLPGEITTFRLTRAVDRRCGR
jgi:hypothetical protein